MTATSALPWCCWSSHPEHISHFHIHNQLRSNHHCTVYSDSVHWFWPLSFGCVFNASKRRIKKKNDSWEVGGIVAEVGWAFLQMISNGSSWPVFISPDSGVTSPLDSLPYHSHKWRQTPPAYTLGAPSTPPSPQYNYQYVPIATPANLPLPTNWSPLSFLLCITIPDWYLQTRAQSVLPPEIPESTTTTSITKVCLVFSCLSTIVQVLLHHVALRKREEKLVLPTNSNRHSWPIMCQSMVDHLLESSAITDPLQVWVNFSCKETSSWCFPMFEECTICYR